jgi:hypothetical protein
VAWGLCAGVVLVVVVDLFLTLRSARHHQQRTQRHEWLI